MSYPELPSMEEDLTGSIEELKYRAREYFTEGRLMRISPNTSIRSFGETIQNRAINIEREARLRWAVKILAESDPNPIDKEKADWIVWEEQICKRAVGIIPSHPRERAKQVMQDGRVLSHTPTKKEIETYEQYYPQLHDAALSYALTLLPAPDGTIWTLEEYKHGLITFQNDVD